MPTNVTDPLISIIIPVYNGVNYLKEAIESALAQTYRHIEIIVINDGSIDETENIALSFGEKIQYLKKPNGGVASALNLGISKMRGEYFSWLSHDDLYIPSKIEKQLDILLKQTRKSIIFSGFNIIDKNADFVSSHIIKNWQKYTKFEMVLYTMIHGCSLLIPKAVFESVGYFDETLRTVQDNHQWLRIAKSDYEFIYIDEPLILSRHHSEQGSIMLKEIQIKEIREFYKWASTYVKDEIEKDEALKKFVLEKF